MTQINVTQPLLNVMTGEVLKKTKHETITLPGGQVATKNVETDEPVTFRSAAMSCLFAHDEDNKDRNVKADRFELAMLIKDNDELSLTESQLNMIRDVVHKFEGVMIYGQINRMLKGTTPDAK